MGIDPFHDELVSHLPYLYRYAFKLCRSATLAEDLVQDTMLRALSSRDLFDGANLPAWLSTILHNQCRTFWKKRRREVLMDMWAGGVMDVPAPNRTDNDAADDLKRLFNGTRPSDHKLLLALSEGDDYQKLAIDLVIPEGTVKSRVSRLRTRSRQLIGRDPPSPPVKRKRPFRRTARWYANHPAKAAAPSC
jgi:RNA polymerase sigma-70 factor, ECF subfamily